MTDQAVVETKAVSVLAKMSHEERGHLNKLDTILLDASPDLMNSELARAHRAASRTTNSKAVGVSTPKIPPLNLPEKP